MVIAAGSHRLKRDIEANGTGEQIFQRVRSRQFLHGKIRYADVQLVQQMEEHDPRKGQSHDCHRCCNPMTGRPHRQEQDCDVQYLATKVLAVSEGERASVCIEISKQRGSFNLAGSEMQLPFGRPIGSNFGPFNQ